MIDVPLMIIGIILLIWAVIGGMSYLRNERGTILDPIAISWAGHALFIGGAMIMTAIVLPERGRDDVVVPCALMMLVGTFCYTIGLYLGKQKSLANMIPRPRANLSDAEIWFMWVVSISAFALSFSFLQVAPMVAPALVNPMRGIIDGSMGAAALLSVMVIVGYKGRVGTKIVMGMTLLGTCALILAWSWSRRPLVGVIVAVGAYFYRERIAWRSTATRVTFFSGVVFAAMFVMLFLGATRGRRFYGEAGGQYEVFSLQNFKDFVEGVTINYEVAEFALVQVPNNHPFLWGSGFVPAFTFLIPRAIWPDKPFGTGWYLTTIWYNTATPDNNLAQTIVAEWYTNFGHPGVAFGMVLIGVLVRAFNTYMRREEQNRVLWPAWLLILPDFATEWRGDFTSMTVQAFLRVSVFLILAWVAGKLTGGARAMPAVPAMPTGARRPLPAGVSRALRGSRRPPVCGP